MFMLGSQTPCMNRTSPTKSNPLYKLWHHDQSLKRCRGVSESKWHDQVLKISEVSVKVHFPFPFLILTRCYEFYKSSLSYYEDPRCSPKAEDNSSRGYLFLTVILFSPWKSIEIERLVFLLYMEANTEWEVDGQIIPAARESVMQHFIISLSGSFSSAGSLPPGLRSLEVARTLDENPPLGCC